MVFGFNTRPPAGQPQMPPVRSAPPTEMQQSSGFTEVLKQPEVQAALIQFGINMLNPTYDGFGGQLGRSIGAAGAAAGRAVGQRAEREEEARRRDLQEREYGLAERRTRVGEKQEERLNRFGSAPGRGLQSMFTKPKPFSAWITDMAQKRQADSFNEILAEDLLADPAWVAQQRQIFNSLHSEGGGGTAAQMGAEEAKAAARAAIAKGAPEEAVRQRLQERWGVTLE